MRIQNKIVLGLAIALTIASVAAAQRRSAPATPSDTNVDVAITLQVAGQPYHFEAKAACQHAPVASIYNLAAEMWSVQQSDGQRSITLTLWHPKSISGAGLIGPLEKTTDLKAATSGRAPQPSAATTCCSSPRSPTRPTSGSSNSSKRILRPSKPAIRAAGSIPAAQFFRVV
jgi:hypothetical protein